MLQQPLRRDRIATARRVHLLKRLVHFAQMVERIVKRFAPERVILFGSHATRKAGSDSDSDSDLLVVMPLKRTKAALEGRVLYAKC